MKDFNFYAPTQVVFGKESEEKVADLVKKYGGTKVLVHYGGGSAKRSGLLDKLFQLLSQAGIPFIELGGVVPNPLLSKVKEGIEICRKEGVDFILAHQDTQDSKETRACNTGQGVYRTTHSRQRGVYRSLRGEEHLHGAIPQ